MGETRWLNAEEQRIWRAYLFATRLMLDRLERDLQEAAGIPIAYYEVLVRLSESPTRTVRMSELADLSLHSRSRLSHAVARLEEVGWVQRESCDSDRRGSYAVLTEAGFDALVAAAPRHVESVRTHLFDTLEPEQLSELRSISEALLEHLVSVGASCPSLPPGCEPEAQQGQSE